MKKPGNIRRKGGDCGVYGGHQEQKENLSSNSRSGRKEICMTIFLLLVAAYQCFWMMKCRLMDNNPRRLEEEAIQTTALIINRDDLPTTTPTTTKTTRAASSSSSSSTITQHTIFFNLYSHPQEDFSKEFYPHAQGRYSSTRIFEEQLTQLIQSRSRFLIKKNFGDGGQQQKKEIWDVYVSTFGNTNMTTHQTTQGDRIQEICNGASSRVYTPIGDLITIQCHHDQNQHIEWGGELDTLTNLYNYCQSHTTSDDPGSHHHDSTGGTTHHHRVTYLHNKGSFHPGEDQHRWRQVMTDAAIHQDCLEPPNEMCSVCGLQFVAPPEIYAPIFPGNFYTASCRYVTQLLPPKVFAKQMEKLSWEIMKWVRRGNFVFATQDHHGAAAGNKNNKPWALGIGRYTAEHWIASHPTVEPCHMYPHEREHWYWRKYGRSSDVTEFEWSMFPGGATKEGGSGVGGGAAFAGGGGSKEGKATTRRRVHNASWIPESIRNDTSKRRKYFEYLPGILYRQLQLYNQTPPLDSWWYQYLPDGGFWKQAVQKYGNDVVNKVINPIL